MNESDGYFYVPKRQNPRSRVIMIDCHSFGNGRNGMTASGDIKVIAINSTFDCNGQHGIQLSGGASATLVGNRTDSNAGDGINVSDIGDVE